MARRSTPYILDLGSDQETELSLSDWNELLANGWIERTGYKSARPRRGVVAWIRGGDLWLTPLARIPSVTARWFLIWLFGVEVISAAHVAETIIERRERTAIEREREAQNEALLWRTHRKTKGANEFRWMTPEQKAEVMRLKPETVAEAA